MTAIRSMTAFSSIDEDREGTRYRIEIRSLNHRFLDLKVRLPRDKMSLDAPLKALLQGKFTRGSIELKLESVLEPGEVGIPELQPNLTLAAQYFECLKSLQKALGLEDPIRTMDIALFPEVITRIEESRAETTETLLLRLTPLIERAIQDVIDMRAKEGSNLQKALEDQIESARGSVANIRSRRTECQALSKDKIKNRITNLFESYPLEKETLKAVIESRVSQELASLLDRTDIEEELTRLEGHLDHFNEILKAGSPVGRKLEFMLQEMNREITTLGNKAQDLPISEEVVRLKVLVEQLREQVMNIE